MVEWLEERSMKVAAGKTEAIMLSGRKKHDAITITLYGSIVPLKSKVKYLGVTIDKYL